MQIVKIIGAYEIRSVSLSECDKPWEIYVRDGGFVEAFQSYGKAVSMARTLDAEDRQRHA